MRQMSCSAVCFKASSLLICLIVRASNLPCVRMPVLVLLLSAKWRASVMSAAALAVFTEQLKAVKAKYTSQAEQLVSGTE